MLFDLWPTWAIFQDIDYFNSTVLRIHRAIYNSALSYYQSVLINHKCPVLGDLNLKFLNYLSFNLKYLDYLTCIDVNQTVYHWTTYPFIWLCFLNQFTIIMADFLLFHQAWFMNIVVVNQLILNYLFSIYLQAK